MNQLRLEVRTIEIGALEFGDETAVEGSTLRVSGDQVRELVLEDPRIADVQVEIAQPGDDVRIIGCLDAVEPRTKLTDGSVFPGFLGGMVRSAAARRCAWVV